MDGWISPSPNVTLFEQLWETSCRRGTDIPHVFFSFCDRVSSNCLHPLLLFLSCFPFFCLLSLSHLSASVCLSRPQISLITWQWKTSPSRSSCWPPGWPQPAWEASPRPRLRSGGATWSWRSLWRSLCSCYVSTDLCTHTLPSPLYLRIQYKLCETWKTVAHRKEAWTAEIGTFLLRRLRKNLFCFIKNHSTNVLKHTR